MNKYTIRAKVKEIEGMQEDAEMAHAAEDELFEAVLTEIAANTLDNPAECAREALKSRKLNFPRWCA